MGWFFIKQNRTLKNIFKIISYTWKHDRSLLFINISKAIADAIIAILGIFLIKVVIDELTNENRSSVLISIVVGYSLIILICNIIGSYRDSKSWYKTVMVRLKLVSLRGKKLMTMDYENAENPEVLDKLERSNQSISISISGSNCGVTQIISNILAVVPNRLITIISYLVIILLLSPWVLLFILVTLYIQHVTNKRLNKIYIKYNQENAPYGRRRNYYEEQMEDPKFAKEIRVYKLAKFLMKKYTIIRQDQISLIRKFNNKYLSFRIFDLFINLIRYGFVNVFLIYEVIDGMTIGNFSLYLAAIIGFSSGMEAVIQIFTNLHRQGLLLNDFFDFIELPDGSEKTLLPTEEPSPISIKNISFTYARTNTPVIKNLSLSIIPGEKIALVGMNGCGKTTLTKLILGLYKPSNGEILYNGININDYNRQAYFNLFSVVFQEVNIFAMTLAENICLCEQNNINYDKLKEAIILAGLGEDVLKLKTLYDTHLMKIFHDDGIEFSGGQTQKLGLARALYQNHGVIILDEPTASLDPLAEYNIYYQFNQIIKNKTAIYISHRLSSTRFCDKIAYIDQGEIIEYGTHDELLGLNGKYAEMFRKQAHYYQENIEEEEVYGLQT